MAVRLHLSSTLIKRLHIFALTQYRKLPKWPTIITQHCDLHGGPIWHVSSFVCIQSNSFLSSILYKERDALVFYTLVTYSHFTFELITWKQCKECPSDKRRCTGKTERHYLGVTLIIGSENICWIFAAIQISICCRQVVCLLLSTTEKLHVVQPADCPASRPSVIVTT